MLIEYSLAYWRDFANFFIARKFVQRKTYIKNLLPASVSQVQMFINFFH